MPGDTRDSTGGKIFFYSAGGFNCSNGMTSRCTMLEYAKDDWASTVTGVPMNGCVLTAGSDPTCPMTNSSSDIVLTTQSPLGYGFVNSQTITQSFSNTGPFAANNYAVSFKDPISGANIPWGLPSIDELVQLCNWANGSFPRSDACAPKSLKSNFKPGVYLSSTVTNEPGRPVLGVNFATGAIVKQPRNVAGYVRPVRALRGSIDPAYVPPTTVAPTTLPPTTLAPTTLPPTTVLSCADGGSCVVGADGPGGGKVFFVSAVGFTCGPTLAQTCHYLEVANLNAAPSAQSGNFPTGQIATSMDIGTGLKNTNAIAALGGADNIAVTVRGLTLGPKKKSDWFIGSKAESIEFCKSIKIGGNKPGDPTQPCTGSMVLVQYNANLPLKTSSLDGDTNVWMAKLYNAQNWQSWSRVDPSWFLVMRAF